MNKWLFQHIDNTGLVLWRVLFGGLITIEAFGAMATGWVRRTFIEPEFTFNFIGFEFLQPLPGDGMYFYFTLMGIFGLMVTFGYKYRVGMLGYTLMWSGVYLMQKTSYNNHYYLMMLLCWLMVFLPAHRWFSIDARQNSKLKSPSVARWVYLVVILQIWIVYTYASVAKIYPDWLNGRAVELFMMGKKDYWLIGGALQNKTLHLIIAYVGILFDLLIVPLMLWKRTRLMAFIFSLVFHLFNSVVFQIGIFPYMSIGFALFFFSSETLRRRFLPKKTIYTEGAVIVPKSRNLLLGVFAIYFLIQIGLPLRHWGFKDDVLWTEEGHRLAWRMMLRSKSGILVVYTEDKATGKRDAYDFKKLLSRKQLRSVKTKADLIWQLAQRIKKVEADNGKDVGVYVTTRVMVNGGEYFPFIDPEVDLTEVEWNHFKHHDWILPSPEDYHALPEKKPLKDPN